MKVIDFKQQLIALIDSIFIIHLTFTIDVKVFNLLYFEAVSNIHLQHQKI